MKKTELKKIDIHADYLMFELNSNLHHALHILITYMQNTTPYGIAYQSAFSKQKQIFKKLQELEHLLQQCVEEKTTKEGEK